MVFLRVLWKGVAGLVSPKPYLMNTQFAKCGTSSMTTTDSAVTTTTTDNLNPLDDCDDDLPVPDMDNPFMKDRRLCVLCQSNITPNYKNTKLLSQFVSMYTGKIYGRHITGLCKKRQEQVETEIKKAQNAGMMPYYLKDPAFMQDPQLFNPDTPFRNHPY